MMCCSIPLGGGVWGGVGGGLPVYSPILILSLWLHTSTRLPHFRLVFSPSSSFTWTGPQVSPRKTEKIPFYLNATRSRVRNQQAAQLFVAITGGVGADFTRFISNRWTWCSRREEECVGATGESCIEFFFLFLISSTLSAIGLCSFYRDWYL